MEKQTSPSKTPSIVITDFDYDEINGLCCIKRKHSERDITSFYEGELWEIEPLLEAEAVILPSKLYQAWEQNTSSVRKVTFGK